MNIFMFSIKKVLLKTKAYQVYTIFILSLFNYIYLLINLFNTLSLVGWFHINLINTNILILISVFYFLLHKPDPAGPPPPSHHENLFVLVKS